MQAEHIDIHISLQCLNIFFKAFLIFRRYNIKYLQIDYVGHKGSKQTLVNHFMITPKIFVLKVAHLFTHCLPVNIFHWFAYLHFN